MKRIMATLALITSSIHSAPDSSKFLEKNHWHYQIILNGKSSLTESDRMNLLYLRMMINSRLGDKNSVYRDSNELYEICSSYPDINDEFNRRYR